MEVEDATGKSLNFSRQKKTLVYCETIAFGKSFRYIEVNY